MSPIKLIFLYLEFLFNFILFYKRVFLDQEIDPEYQDAKKKKSEMTCFTSGLKASCSY
jgi:hypothetical protein